MQKINPKNLSSIFPLVEIFPNLVDGDIENRDEKRRSLIKQEMVSKSLELEDYYQKLWNDSTAWHTDFGTNVC